MFSLKSDSKCFYSDTGVIQMPFVAGPQPFNYEIHGNNSALEWKNWLRSFELYIKVIRCDNDTDKCSMLLHYA